MKKICFLGLFGLLGINLFAQKSIDNYVFFGMDRERIGEASFLEHEKIIGAQLKYSWKELEPVKDKYEFGEIRNDLDFLSSHGKRLYIQLQDVTFDTVRVFVPDYIMKGSNYGGGANIQYITGENDSIIRQDGYMARRWDPNVAERFHKLIKAIAHEFDGKIEGLNFSETAVGFGESEKLYPEGFSPKIYRDAIVKQMEVAREAFTKSVVLQYANFMPGEWLPWENNGFLESLYRFASEHDVAMGGPDIKIYKKAQMNHSYKFLKKYSDDIKTGIAVQWGNYEEFNPKTGIQVTVEEIYNFGKDEIGLDYIFWCTQEPYYSDFLLPYLKNVNH